MTIIHFPIYEVNLNNISAPFAFPRKFKWNEKYVYEWKYTEYTWILLNLKSKRHALFYARAQLIRNYIHSSKTSLLCLIDVHSTTKWVKIVGILFKERGHIFNNKIEDNFSLIIHCFCRINGGLTVWGVLSRIIFGGPFWKIHALKTPVW